MHKNYTFIVPLEYYLNKCPELLFIQYDENIQNNTRTMHAHDFWQLEIVVSGYLEVKSKKVKLKAGADDYIFIPPGIPHRIIYENSNQKTWSIKFKIKTKKMQDRIILLKRSTASINARNDILKILNMFDRNYDSYITLQYLLGMLIELEFQQISIESSSFFLDQIKMLIASYEGRPVSIKELADKLKRSRNHISKKFHTETEMTLKAFIDSNRAEIARKMLIYSNQKIIAIAEIMEFPNVYSFSRFFRHHNGVSPRQYKNVKKTMNL